MRTRHGAKGLFKERREGMEAVAIGARAGLPAYGPCLGHAWAIPVPSLGYVWAMPVPCLCHAWAMPGPCLGHAWAMPGRHRAISGDINYRVRSAATGPLLSHQILLGQLNSFVCLN